MNAVLSFSKIMHKTFELLLKPSSNKTCFLIILKTISSKRVNMNRKYDFSCANDMIGVRWIPFRNCIRCLVGRRSAKWKFQIWYVSEAILLYCECGTLLHAPPVIPVSADGLAFQPASSDLLFQEQVIYWESINTSMKLRLESSFLRKIWQIQQKQNIGPTLVSNLISYHEFFIRFQIRKPD